MKKYKQFMENLFVIVQFSIAIIAALTVALFFVVSSGRPMTTVELEQHMENLESIKEDYLNATKIENAVIEVEADEVTVTLKGSYSNLKAYFDADGNYISSKIIDKLLYHNFAGCILMVFLTFIATYGFTCLLKVFLYMPIGIWSAMQRKNNNQDKKKGTIS